jgi:hypothetical protein
MRAQYRTSHALRTLIPHGGSGAQAAFAGLILQGRLANVAANIATLARRANSNGRN